MNFKLYERCKKCERFNGQSPCNMYVGMVLTSFPPQETDVCFHFIEKDNKEKDKHEKTKQNSI